MDLGVAGRNYIIVGGTRGMGHAAARILAAEGANVAIIGRTQSVAIERAAEMPVKDDNRVVGLAGDGTVPGSVETAIANAVEELGVPRGLLITSGSTYRYGDLLETAEEDWRATFDDVYMGHVRALKATVPHMLAAGGGNIVTTAAYSSRAPKSFLFAYSSMKTALINLTKNIAKTYGDRGVRGNCVCPGAFETSRVSEHITRIAERDGVDREAAARHLVTVEYAMPIALPRLGQAHEAGDLMAFLLSERAAYMTGAIINIDGGSDF